MKKILLIDDNPDIHLMIKFVLEKSGYELVSAYSGDEGLAKFLDLPPDLVILDNMMPQKSGEETFHEFMHDPRYQHLHQIPFIMLTAKQTSNQQIKDLLRQGMAAFLYKPFGQRELLNVIQNILTTHEIQIQRQDLMEAIKEAKDFLKKLVENIPNALFIVTNSGMISFYNGGNRDVLKYADQDLINQPFIKLLGSSSALLQQIRTTLDQKEKINNLEINLTSKNGILVPFNMSVALLKNEENKKVGMIFIGTDVSEIKRLEQQLVEKEKLAMLTETAIAVNHEINNPLSPILGNVQLLLQQKDRFDQPTYHRLEAIQRNALRIQEITDKLRKIKRPVQKSYLGDTKMLDIHESN